MSSSATAPPTTSAATTSSTQEDLKRHQCSGFLAGDENVVFVPSFTHEKPMELLCRTSIGPFRAGLDTVVPLWLAVLLRQRNMGRIVPPVWMDVTVLKGVLAHERDASKASFSSELPFRYQEVARSILAFDDLDHAAEIRLLLQDIMTVRMDKIKQNLHTLSQQSLSQATTLPIIDVTHIGSLELAVYRPFITRAFRNHLTLTRKETKSGNNKLSSSENVRSAARRASKIQQQEADSDDDDDAEESDLETPKPQQPVQSRIRRRLR